MFARLVIVVGLMVWVLPSWARPGSGGNSGSSNSAGARSYSPPPAMTYSSPPPMPFIATPAPAAPRAASPVVPRVEPMPNPVIPAIPYRSAPDPAPRPPQGASGGGGGGTMRSGTFQQTIQPGAQGWKPLDLGQGGGRATEPARPVEAGKPNTSGGSVQREQGTSGAPTIDRAATGTPGGTMRSGTYRETIQGGQQGTNPLERYRPSASDTRATGGAASGGSTPRSSQDSGAAQRDYQVERDRQLRQIDELRAQRQRAAAAGALGGSLAAAHANKPANATETKPRRDTANADGSRTYDHYDASGRHVGTTVVGAKNEIQQTFQRNADGTTTTFHPLAGTSRTSNPDGSGITKYRDGTEVRDRMVNGERVTEAVRNGEPLYRYRARQEQIGRETVYVHVPAQSSSNDLFWIWLLMSQNRRAEEARRADSGFTPGGGYSGGATPGGAPSAAVPPMTFQPFVYDWKKDFEHLPASMNTLVEYRDPLDWITDYIIFDLVNEYSTPPPAPGFFGRLWMTLGIVSRPPAVEVQYELSQEIRALLAEEIIPIIQKIRSRQPVRLRDFVNLETGDVQPLTIIANEEFQVRNLDTAANCGIDPGDVLQLESFFVGSETTGVKVLHTDHAADSCEEGSTVGVKLTNLQNGLNELVRRIERGIAKAAQKRPGMASAR